MLRVVAFIRKFLLLALAATGLSLGCATARPPVEQGSFHKPELVELVRLDPTIHLDIRYATADNIVHRPVYRQARAFLQRGRQRSSGSIAPSRRRYGLLVFDGYRPWSVTKLFWDASGASSAPSSRTRRKARSTTAAARWTSRCTTSLREGGRDAERLRRDLRAGLSRLRGRDGGQRARRDLLRAAMEKEGFTVEPNEWWHFNYKDWKEYPILDIPFESIPDPAARQVLRGGVGRLFPKSSCRDSVMLFARDAVGCASNV